MSSEVAWLFLIAYWIAGLALASFLYARWNRGLGGQVEVGRVVRSGAISPRDLIPDHLLRAGPQPEPIFEGDQVEVQLTMRSRHGARGPARMSGMVGRTELRAATGVVPASGWRESRTIGAVRRGRLEGSGWTLDTGDLAGFFANPRQKLEPRLPLVLPTFTSLAADPRVRELEVSLAAPRAGTGTELFGIREYRAGDPLRRIHWRSSARRGELVVREYEPPGVQTLAILCDPRPPSIEAADQVARIAASEAWDCLRGGGQVVLWAPGCEPTGRDESRSMWGALEWLARYPEPGGAGAGLPQVSDAVVVTASPSPELMDALEEVRLRGGSARAWAVGDVELVVDAPVQRVGLNWPP